KFAYRSELTLANGRQINIINIKTFIKAIIPTPTTLHFPHASSAKTYLLVVLLGSYNHHLPVSVSHAPMSMGYKTHTRSSSAARSEEHTSELQSRFDL